MCRSKTGIVPFDSSPRLEHSNLPGQIEATAKSLPSPSDLPLLQPSVLGVSTQRSTSDASQERSGGARDLGASILARAAVPEYPRDPRVSQRLGNL